MARLIFLGNALVAWQSRRIATVVTSTCAAEYIAASRAAEKVAWLRALLAQMTGKALPPTTLSVDNTAAIAVARATAKTRKSKYIDVHYHSVRDRIARGELVMRHKPSTQLAADALTKVAARTPISSALRNHGLAAVARCKHAHGCG
eukprot:IDg3510t1